MHDLVHIILRLMTRGDGEGKIEPHPRKRGWGYLCKRK